MLCVATVCYAGEPVRFNRDVRPILSNHCFSCHGPDASARESGLRLDTESEARGELESGDGHAIVPGDIAASQLWQRVISYDEDVRMPPGGDPLTPHQLDILRRWIEQGANWQPHWSYTPPSDPAIPQNQNVMWADNPIDQFVLARIERAGLAPSGRADRVTLIRRLSFDLLGLPPTAEAVAQFVQDDQPDAYERLVDRLLCSPRFGERMAVYWLDLVRYADTVGYHGDQDHSISPYRDYVIRAFNANLPFDQFTIEQLAGDLLPNATMWQKVASGYNRLLQTTHEGGAQDAEYRAKYAADRVRTTSSVWMGATMGCCECHDHKFDPYTLKDFYRFAAFFADVKEHGAYPAPNALPTKRLPEMLVIDPVDDKRLAELDAQLCAAQSRLKEAPDEESLQQTVKDLESRRDTIQQRGRLTMITEAVQPRMMRVLARGDWMDTTGPIAQPAIPQFMGQLETPGNPTRLDLARWLTLPDHPQTARVMVNRLWQLFTGVGISKVTEDLGSQGEWPVNPELLDWMASEFVRSDWDLKHMVRLIVTSRGYQQSSLETEQLRQRDPENRLLARQSRFRLDAEFIRDSALAISGLLVAELGGRSVKPYQPAGYYAHLNFPERRYSHDTNAGQYRRGLYVHWQRQFLHPMLKAFDAPSREECTARRPRSNTPLAALTLLNDPSFIEAARVFAERIIETDATDDAQRLVWAFRQVFSREPTQREAQLLLSMLQRQRESFEQSPESAAHLTSIGMKPLADNMNVVEVAAWTSVSRALLNVNEAIMRN